MIRHERGEAEGIEQMRGALDALVTHNVVLRIPMFLSMLAEAALQRRYTDLAGGEHQRPPSATWSARRRAWCRPEVLRVLGSRAMVPRRLGPCGTDIARRDRGGRSCRRAVVRTPGRREPCRVPEPR